MRSQSVPYSEWPDITTNQSASREMTSLSIFRHMIHEKQPVVPQSLHSCFDPQTVNVVCFVTVGCSFSPFRFSILICRWQCCCYSIKEDWEQIAYCRECVFVRLGSCETEVILFPRWRNIQRKYVKVDANKTRNISANCETLFEWTLLFTHCSSCDKGGVN